MTPKYLEHVCFSRPTCHCPLCGCLSTVVITFSHTHTCMCVCLRACMCLHTHVEARGQPLMFAVVRNRISHWPGADQLGQAGWAASPRACLTLSPQSQHHNCSLLHPGFWGSNSGPYVTNAASSLSTESSPQPPCSFLKLSCSDIYHKLG